MAMDALCGLESTANLADGEKHQHPQIARTGRCFGGLVADLR
jgi:hypothetical protein